MGVMCVARSVDEVSGQIIHAGGDVMDNRSHWLSHTFRHD
jgi:hypothetical protein